MTVAAPELGSLLGCLGLRTVRCSVRPRHTDAQPRDSLSHVRDRGLHIGAALVFSGDVRVEIRDLVSEMAERLFTLTVGQLGTDTMLERSQFFDMPHRVVDRADLSLQVGEQIKLVRGECFGLFLERTYLDGSERFVAHRRCWFAAISRYGLGCTAQSTCTNLHSRGEWSKIAAPTPGADEEGRRMPKRSHGRGRKAGAAVRSRVAARSDVGSRDDGCGLYCYDRATRLWIKIGG
jgi:hypothetical protein